MRLIKMDYDRRDKSLKARNAMKCEEDDPIYRKVAKQGNDSNLHITSYMSLCSSYV